MKRLFFSVLIMAMVLACNTASQLAATPTPIPPTETPTLTETPGPTETPTLTPTPEFACPTAPETRLEIGDMARVTEGGTASVRLRREPVIIDDTILTIIPLGTEFEIIDGPKCVPIPDNEASFVMWMVHVPGKEAPFDEGWVAEGDANGYYIEPVPEGEAP